MWVKIEILARFRNACDKAWTWIAYQSRPLEISSARR